MARDSFSAGTRIKGGIGFRPQMVRGASVPRLIPYVRVESFLVNEIDALGQTWRKPSPMRNSQSLIRRRSPTGHQLNRNLTFGYELETCRLARRGRLIATIGAPPAHGIIWPRVTRKARWSGGATGRCANMILVGQCRQLEVAASACNGDWRWNNARSGMEQSGSLPRR